MVALDARNVHGPDGVQAFLRVGIVTHHIAQAGDVRAFLLLDILQYHLERLQIGVDIGDNRIFHLNSPVPALAHPVRNFKMFRNSFLRVHPIRLFLPDKPADIRLPDRLHEPFQFGADALGD